jgi:hypothetical protein
MDAAEIAQRIQQRHVPVGEPGWQRCKACGQSSAGMMGERFPSWPCDARRLADALVGEPPPPPEPEPIVYLYERSPFPDWDRGRFVAEAPQSEAEQRAAQEGLIIHSERR